MLDNPCPRGQWFKNTPPDALLLSSLITQLSLSPVPQDTACPHSKRKSVRGKQPLKYLHWDEKTKVEWNSWHPFPCEASSVQAMKLQPSVKRCSATGLDAIGCYRKQSYPLFCAHFNMRTRCWGNPRAGLEDGSCQPLGSPAGCCVWSPTSSPRIMMGLMSSHVSSVCGACGRRGWCPQRQWAPWQLGARRFNVLFLDLGGNSLTN